MSKKSVAVMNSSKEITELMQEVLEMEGFFVSTIYTYIFKNQKEKFDEFIKENKPKVIVYDIAVPYKDNYELFTQLSEQTIAKEIVFVLTTTNKDALDSLVGSTNAIEIIGKPFDLDLLLNKVTTAYEKINSV